MTYGTGIYGIGPYGASATPDPEPQPPTSGFEPGRPTRISIDGLPLNWYDADLDLAWRFTKIDGWRGGVGVEVDQVQRTNGHGQFAQPGHRTGRVLTVTGRLEARERSAVAVAVERLEALLADGGFGRLAFTDRTHGERWTTVQLLSAPDIVWNGGPVASYQIGLLAPDSYKYGTESTAQTGFAAVATGSGLVFPLASTLDGVLDFGEQGSVGTLRVANPGTAPASILFTVAGPTPSGGFTITELGTDNRITFLGAVPAGATLTIDTRNGQVLINGTADRLGETIVTRWPRVPQQGAAEFLFAPIGAPTAAVLTAATVATYS